MRILILGATGFIGRKLVLAAARAGHEVVAASRSGASIPGASSTLQWALASPLPAAACRAVDCAVHLAHDFDGAEGARRSISGTLDAVLQIRAAGVQRQIFVSSYSAGEHAASLYGRCKHEIEIELAAWQDVTICRPGLVLGEGGIYGRIRAVARIAPIVPLPDGGRGVVPVIAIERLCAELLALCAAPQVPPEANLFEPALVSLRSLVLAAAAEAGRHPLILPIPSGWLLLALRLCKAVHLRLPVSEDNLLGFLRNQGAAHASSLRPNP